MKTKRILREILYELRVVNDNLSAIAGLLQSNDIEPECPECEDTSSPDTIVIEVDEMTDPDPTNLPLDLDPVYDVSPPGYCPECGRQLVDGSESYNCENPNCPYSTTIN